MSLSTGQRGQVIARIAEAVYSQCAAAAFNAGHTADGPGRKRLREAAEFSVAAASTLVDFVLDNAGTDTHPEGP